MTLEAAKGVDPDFGKDAHRLSAIRTAPFYGVRTSGYMLCTLDGITINENFQAVDDNGKAIEGLYVMGVDSGSYYATRIRICRPATAAAAPSPSAAWPERPSPRNKAKWKTAEGDWQLLTLSPMIAAIKEARVLDERLR